MIFKNFKQYSPKNPLYGNDAVYLRDEQNNDWYDIQKQFSKNTMKIAFNDSGLIISCSKDISALFPIDCNVTEVEFNEDLTGLYFFNGSIVFIRKPSDLHTWNGQEWTISKANLAEFITRRKETLLTTIANRADQLKTGLLAGYPQTEIESFYRQEKEALAWQADHNTPTPMLSQIARVRGVPLEVLISKVIEKSAQFAVAIGIIIGQRQAFEDRLMAVQTLEELEPLSQEIEQWQFQVN